FSSCAFTWNCCKSGVSNLSKRSSRGRQRAGVRTTEVPSMLLRDRPFKFCHGTSNWPSEGTDTGQLEKTHPKRKVPVLKSAIPSLIHSADRFFLCTDYEDHLTPAASCSTTTLCASRHRSRSIFAATVQWLTLPGHLLSLVLRSLKKERKQKEE